MRYDETSEHVRAHFRELLREFEGQVAEGGPGDGLPITGVRNAQSFAEADPEIWAELVHREGQDGLLTAFCERRGISAGEVSADDRRHIVTERQKGHRAYAEAALCHNASLAELDLGVPPEKPFEPPEGVQDDGPGCRGMVERYFTEAARGRALAATTESSKRDGLDLLGQIMGDRPLAELSKADAQNVKDVLLRPPVNRNKSPRTRGLSLERFLEVDGVSVVSPRTVRPGPSEYLEHIRHG